MRGAAIDVKAESDKVLEIIVFGFGRVGSHICVGGIISCRRGVVFCGYAVFRCRVGSRTPLRGCFFRRRGKIAQGSSTKQSTCKDKKSGISRKI